MRRWHFGSKEYHKHAHANGFEEIREVNNLGDAARALVDILTLAPFRWGEYRNILEDDGKVVTFDCDYEIRIKGDYTIIMDQGNSDIVLW